MGVSKFLTEAEAIQAGLSIFETNLPADRTFEEMKGQTPREKVLWVLFRLNWKDKWIADAFGVTIQSVQNWKTKFSIPKTSRSD